MSQETDDVFDLIEQDVASLRDHAPVLVDTWRDLARELAFVEAARDCAQALKSAREEALHEIGLRLSLWQPVGDNLARQLGVPQSQVDDAVEQMFQEGQNR